jgi:hypothetical protein
MVVRRVSICAKVVEPIAYAFLQLLSLQFIPLQLDTLSLEETFPECPYLAHAFLALSIGMFLALWN